MDFIPGGLRHAVPDLAKRDTPTSTSVVSNDKITHALGKLAQAGVVDDSNLVPSSSTSIAAEKITHATEQLTNAGLTVGNTQSTSSSSHLATKYIVIIAVVAAVVVLALVTGGFMCWRRYRRRRAYNVVSRGLDNKGKGIIREKEDMFNADMQESESFNVDGQKLTEQNFESGYDKVDTGYEGTGYGGVEEHGDKRARLQPGEA